MQLAFLISAHQNANQKPIRSVPSYRAQCILPPQPIYQTLVFDFQRSGSKTTLMLGGHLEVWQISKQSLTLSKCWWWWCNCSSGVGVMGGYHWRFITITVNLIGQFLTHTHAHTCTHARTHTHTHTHSSSSSVPRGPVQKIIRWQRGEFEQQTIFAWVVTAQESQLWICMSYL